MKIEIEETAGDDLIRKVARVAKDEGFFNILFKKNGNGEVLMAVLGIGSGVLAEKIRRMKGVRRVVKTTRLLGDDFADFKEEHIFFSKNR